MFGDHRRFQNNGGFTIVELLVTIGVLAMLATISIPITKSYYKRARKVECQVSVINFLAAQELYYLDNNNFWPLEQGEVLEKTKDIGWNPGDRPDQPAKYSEPFPYLGIDFRQESHRGYRIKAVNDQQPNLFEQSLTFNLRTNEGFHNDGTSDYPYTFEMYNRQDPGNPSWSTNGKWEVRNSFWFNIFGCSQWTPPCPR
jgi:prepilin-type N-terminal cleavage/methylation domain-containing protein